MNGSRSIRIKVLIIYVINEVMIVDSKWYAFTSTCISGKSSLFKDYTFLYHSPSVIGPCDSWIVSKSSLNWRFMDMCDPTWVRIYSYADKVVTLSKVNNFLGEFVHCSNSNINRDCTNWKRLLNCDKRLFM